MTLYDAYIILCEPDGYDGDLQTRVPREMYTIVVDGKRVRNIEIDTRLKDSKFLWVRNHDEEPDYFPKDYEVYTILKSKAVKISNGVSSS